MIRGPKKYERYLRVDGESLSVLLGKVPAKGEPGYLADDDEEETAASSSTMEKKWSAGSAPSGADCTSHRSELQASR